MYQTKHSADSSDKNQRLLDKQNESTKRFESILMTRAVGGLTADKGDTPASKEAWLQRNNTEEMFSAVGIRKSQLPTWTTRSTCIDERDLLSNS